MAPNLFAQLQRIAAVASIIWSGTPALANDVYFVTDRKPCAPVHGIFHANCDGAQKFFGPYRSAIISTGCFTVNRHSKTDQQHFVRSREVKEIPADGGTALVFVHGFNSKFDHYLDVVDELAEMLRAYPEYQKGFTPILYSWPSMGSPFAYMQDECSSQWTYPKFQSFMRNLRQQRFDRIVLVSHSLGSQIVYRYLMETPNDDHKIDRVIFSSPDIDYQTFADDLFGDKVLLSKANKVYVLVSDVDIPLELSRSLHGYTRLGRPSLSSTTSAFLGMFRTGSIRNIFASTCHLPELYGKDILFRLAHHGESSDTYWASKNSSEYVEDPKISFYDFTEADKRRKFLHITPFGHSICSDLIASLIATNTLPQNYTTTDIVKVPDYYKSCTVIPWKSCSPYEDKSDSRNSFRYKRIEIGD